MISARATVINPPPGHLVRAWGDRTLERRAVVILNSELRKTSQMTGLRRGKRRMGEIVCMMVVVIEREKEWSGYNYLRRDNIIYKAS